MRGRDIARKFEAAWNVFASTCAQFIAPEPTYQAWFAHYLISQFGIDRVAREPMVKKAAFKNSDWKAKVAGDHVRLDVVVMSRPEFIYRTTPAASAAPWMAPGSSDSRVWQ